MCVMFSHSCTISFVSVWIVKLEKLMPYSGGKAAKTVVGGIRSGASASDTSSASTTTTTAASVSSPVESTRETLNRLRISSVESHRCHIVHYNSSLRHPRRDLSLLLIYKTMYEVYSIPLASLFRVFTHGCSSRRFVHPWTIIRPASKTFPIFCFLNVYPLCSFIGCIIPADIPSPPHIVPQSRPAPTQPSSSSAMPMPASIVAAAAAVRMPHDPGVEQDDEFARTFIRPPKNEPLGLDIRQFAGGAAIPSDPNALSDARVIEDILREHTTMCAILAMRQTNIKVVRSLWMNGDIKVYHSSSLIFSVCFLMQCVEQGSSGSADASRRSCIPGRCAESVVC